MSYDVWTEPAPHPACTAAQTESESLNMTSNVAPVWRAAGCDIAEFDGKSTTDLAAALTPAIARIEAHPRSFDEFVRGDGTWGTVESALGFMRGLSDLCQQGSGIVRVSR